MWSSQPFYMALQAVLDTGRVRQSKSIILFLLRFLLSRNFPFLTYDLTESFLHSSSVFYMNIFLTVQFPITFVL